MAATTQGATIQGGGPDRRSVRRPVRLRRRLLAGAAALLASGLVLLAPGTASAHSLESSTISTHVTEDDVDATVTIALATLDQALGSDWTADDDVAGYADEVTDYLADHLTVTGADGTVWAETFSGAATTTVEGIDSFTVDVAFDTAGEDPSTFTISYDAVIEAVEGHEAVVVLTDADGEVSTPGVITASEDSLTITTGSGGSTGTAARTGILDMVRYGFHHVLDGADHLLFLTALLLTAPVVAVAGRWRRRTEVLPTGRDLLAVVTAFTVGHSATLVASALGWVSVPATLVEILVATSVGMAALHAVRPLVRRGEVLIAAGFGLVHGLAFAGILADLGLTGSLSLPALLAFNVGVELAQLLATALLFPSLYLIARTRFYPAVRTVGAGVALAAAAGWVVERSGLAANPLAPVEAAALGHPWVVVWALAALAVGLWAVGRRGTARRGAGRPTAEAGQPSSSTSSAPSRSRPSRRVSSGSEENEIRA